ncbi:MAG: PstA family ABC transporter permease [Planctomycetota bacterium]
MRLDLNPRQRVREWVTTFVAVMAAIALVGACGALLWDIVGRGAVEISWDFLTGTPESAGRRGGIAPMLVATAAIVGVGLAAALPVSLGTAWVLSQSAREQRARGRLTNWISRSLDTLAAVPSIVFGLFGAVFFCDVCGLGFSIISGGLTLACMILPVLIRTTEIGLRAVSEAQHQGAAALALGKTTTLFAIILPAAAPAVVAGVIIGLGRSVAETAALIFTSGYVDRMPTSLFDSGRALSVHVYDLAMNVPGGEARAYASALVLVLVTLVASQVTHALLAEFERRRYT